MVAKPRRKPVVPVKFEWGTFCRQILITAGTNDERNRESTLVSILPGLDINIQAVGDAPVADVEIPFVVWVHAVFRCVEIVDRERTLNIDAMITQPKREPMLQKVEVELRPNQETLQLNMEIQMLGRSKGLVVSEGKQRLKASFRHGDVDLGKIELPLNVKVNRVEPPSEESEKPGKPEKPAKRQRRK